MAGIEVSEIASKPIVELNSHAQGLVTDKLSLQQIDGWLVAEIEGWKSETFRGDVSIGGLATVSIDLGSMYTPKLQQIRKEAAKGNLDPLKAYLQQSEILDVLLLQSELGASVRMLEPKGCHFVAAACSTGVVNFGKAATKDFFVQAKSLIAVNPFISTGMKLAEARSLRSDARRQLKQSSEVLKRLEAREKDFETDLSAQIDRYAINAVSDRERYEKWFAEQEKALEETRDTYHKHVQTAEASKFWRTKAITSTILAWVAFVAFGGMVGVALWVGWSNLSAIKSYVQDLASSNSTVSLTPIVVVTIPVLAYAWVLRHLSRVFIQNLTVADDAAYRRLMTMTFLGLTHDPKSGVTQAERAIILNALFRPAPPNTTEDGPPTGLLDIITKK